jgi:hypothetical protein
MQAQGCGVHSWSATQDLLSEVFDLLRRAFMATLRCLQMRPYLSNSSNLIAWCSSHTILEGIEAVSLTKAFFFSGTYPTASPLLYLCVSLKSAAWSVCQMSSVE